MLDGRLGGGGEGRGRTGREGGREVYSQSRLLTLFAIGGDGETETFIQRRKCHAASKIGLEEEVEGGGGGRWA